MPHYYIITTPVTLFLLEYLTGYFLCRPPLCSKLGEGSCPSPSVSYSQCRARPMCDTARQSLGERRPCRGEGGVGRMVLRDPPPAGGGAFWAELPLLVEGSQIGGSRGQPPGGLWGGWAGKTDDRGRPAKKLRAALGSAVPWEPDVSPRCGVKSPRCHIKKAKRSSGVHLDIFNVMYYIQSMVSAYNN